MASHPSTCLTISSTLDTKTSESSEFLFASPTRKHCKVKVYGSVTLENLAIVRANNKYYGKPWFSNVSVLMNIDELFEYASDKGVCYGQVIV